MDWWIWVILVLIALAALTTLGAVIQRKRRRGGVIGLGDTGPKDLP